MTQEREPSPAALAEFLQRHPALEYVEAFLTDVNGIARGKRLPAHALERLFQTGLCLPASTLVLDVWGQEVVATGLIFDTGDADLFCHPVEQGLRPLPWSEGRGAQLLLCMRDGDGEPYAADPRNVLAGVVDRFRARGQTPVVATELEFRLFDAESGEDGRPRPLGALGQSASQLFGLDELDILENVFSEIDRACREQELPADTIIAEQSTGQYEVNLRHVADPLLAADQAILFKRTVKAVARRHGLIASFMAKPFGNEAGNGLHVHASLLDKDGRNLFSDEAGGETDTLRHAIGGLTGTMADLMAVLAPHANSWRRFQPYAHVPMAPTWGHDNRTTAVRIPLSSPEATRIEHRVAGADANPYLVLAAVLAGIDHGITQALEPAPETGGNAFEEHEPALPVHWDSALRAFERSEFAGAYLGSEYRRLFTAVKRQELETFRTRVPRAEYETYLTIA